MLNISSKIQKKIKTKQNKTQHTYNKDLWFDLLVIVCFKFCNPGFLVEQQVQLKPGYLK